MDYNERWKHLSSSRGTNTLYITPTAVRKATIIPETVVRMPIFQGKLVTEGHKASGELDSIASVESRQD